MTSQQQDCVLVTGGCGFIGSHTVVELLQEGWRVVVLDNLANSSVRSLDGVRAIVGAEAASRLAFVEGDVLDEPSLRAVFDLYRPRAVIHFAGLKAVGESVHKPLEYYHVNVGGMLSLARVMREAGCHQLVFSSSSTVYGDPDTLPLTEESPKKLPTNPYGMTKWMIEQIIEDWARADAQLDAVILRYFNPIGAHESGRIGEDPNGIPNNLCPYVAQTAVGKREVVHVFGNDYPTPDGTGVRDYIHVSDLAAGHVAALTWMQGKTGVEVFNLGTGVGTSVLELINAFSAACGHTIPYVIDPRRDGDIAMNYASAAKANRELGWVATRDIARMCEDTWRWQSTHPNGFREAEGEAPAKTGTVAPGEHAAPEARSAAAPAAALAVAEKDGE
jgi:UDP-glucose 4-epimerase